jgi:hypothetical protein
LGKQNDKPTAVKLTLDPTYLAKEMDGRVALLREQLAEKRVECLHIEGQIAEASYWLHLVRTAQPIPGGGDAQGTGAASVEKE